MYFTFFLLILTSITSYLGFKDSSLIDKYAFSINRLLKQKDYKLLITSGFFHINWMHLVINMFVLFSFGTGIEGESGIVTFLLIYFFSLAGGNLLSLLIHKHQPHYTSVGASGAISGLIFSCIVMYRQIRLFFLPGWIFGILYIAYTLYAIRANRRDVGHAAHLGGGLVGMLVAVMLFPHLIANNWLILLAIFVPTVLFLFIMVYKPEWIYINNADVRRTYTFEDRYNIEKNISQSDIDSILEKINKKGMQSLTREERQQLEHYSKQ